MAVRSLREWRTCAAIRTEAKEELRRRILDIVNHKGPITDMALWRESAPDFLPWKFMLKELWEMNIEGKLRREIKSPGNWILHSIEAMPAEMTAAVQAAKSPKPRTAVKTKKPAKRKHEVSVG